MAVRNMQENNTTESKYLTLAKKGWLRVYQLMTDEFELFLERKETAKIIQALQGTDFPGVLKDILPEKEIVGSGGKVEPSLGKRRTGDSRQQVDPIYQHGWEVVQGELQREMDQGDFDTWVSSIRLVKVKDGQFVFETCDYNHWTTPLNNLVSRAKENTNVSGIKREYQKSRS